VGSPAKPRFQSIGFRHPMDMVWWLTEQSPRRAAAETFQHHYGHSPRK
jgi:hypothetical protein